MGQKNLDFAVVDHPFGGIPETDLLSRIESAWDQVNEWLESERVREAFPDDGS